MSHTWMKDVAADLHTYARHNSLDDVAAAAAELYAVITRSLPHQPQETDQLFRWMCELERRPSHTCPPRAM